MPRRTTPTLEAAVAEFQEVRAITIAPATPYNDGRLLAKFVADVGSERQIHTLTARDVEKWFAAEAARLTASSFNKSRNRVNTFFGFCQKRGWMDADPLAFVGRQKEVRRERFKLSPEELLELVEYARTERDRAFVALAMNTGLRAGELVNLRIRDVDLANGYLRVVVSKSAIEDLMPISSDLDPALRRWFAHYEADAGELEPDWYLFPRREPHKG